MNTKTEAQEIWKTTTAKGANRYWRFSNAAFRAVPVKRSDAELGLLAGTHVLTAKPAFVGR